MKKAKILLTAVTILAIVGSIFAFKTNTVALQPICTAVESGECEGFTRMYTATPNAANPVTTLYTTTTTTINNDTTCPTNGCTVLTPLYTEEVE